MPGHFRVGWLWGRNMLAVPMTRIPPARPVPPGRLALRLVRHHADWQVSWGFRGRSVDRPRCGDGRKSLSGGQVSPDLRTWLIQYGSEDPRKKVDFCAVGTCFGSHTACPKSVLRARTFRYAHRASPSFCKKMPSSRRLNSTTRLARRLVPCSTIGSVRRIPLISVTRGEILGSVMNVRRVAEAG